MQQPGTRIGLAIAAVVVIAVVSVVVVVSLGSSGGIGATPTATHGPATAAPTRSAAAATGLPTPSNLPASPAPTAAPPAVMVGAGDIASCLSKGDEATAALLEAIEGTVFTLGDNVYENGTSAEYRDCYGPSWGRPSIKDRTRPVPGNHEYNTRDAKGYYGYFGSAAGDPAKGYYAYDEGTWRVYVLNSNCEEVGGCDAGSVQEQWLRDDLTANPHACVLAMWHHPRFSSGGEHGSSTATEALWQALSDFDAELVLAGHDHLYERFAPQTANGVLGEAHGLVEIIVGTGGRSHYPFGTIRSNSLIRNNDTYGVMRLALSAGSWSYEFIPEAGKTFTDSGSGTCH